MRVMLSVKTSRPAFGGLAKASVTHPFALERMLNEIVNVAEAYRILEPVAPSALRRTIVLA